MRIKALLLIAFVWSCPLVAAAQAGGPAGRAPTPTPTPAASAPVDEKKNADAGAQPVAPADNPGTQPLSTVGTSAGAVTPERGTTPTSEAAVPLRVARGSVALPPEKAAPVRIPRVERPPVLDGKLDDEIWRQAAVLKDFYQISPGDNIAPSLATEVYMAYDARTLYIAFRAHDDPAKVRARRSPSATTCSRTKTACASCSIRSTTGAKLTCSSSTRSASSRTASAPKGRAWTSASTS